MFHLPLSSLLDCHLTFHVPSRSPVHVHLLLPRFLFLSPPVRRPDGSFRQSPSRPLFPLPSPFLFPSHPLRTPLHRFPLRYACPPSLPRWLPHGLRYPSLSQHLPPLLHPSAPT